MPNCSDEFAALQAADAAWQAALTAEAASLAAHNAAKAIRQQREAEKETALQAYLDCMGGGTGAP